MPPDKLLVDVADYFFDGEFVPLFRDSTLQSDVEKNVAKLDSQLSPITGVNGLDGLICFFDKSLAERFVRLHAIPGTVCSQPFHYFEKAFEFLVGAHFVLLSTWFNIEKKA